MGYALMSALELVTATGYVVAPYDVAEASATGGWVRAARDALAEIGTTVRSLLPPLQSTDVMVFSDRAEVRATGTVGVGDVVPRWQTRVLERTRRLLAEQPGRIPMVSAALIVAQSLLLVDTPVPAVSWSEDDGVEFTWHRNGWHVGIEVGLEGTTFSALQYGAPVDSVQDGLVEDRRELVDEIIEALSH
jgi:hypothetical protein